MSQRLLFEVLDLKIDLDCSPPIKFYYHNHVEHFIVENDVITNPKESLEKGYKYVASVQLKD